MIDSYKMNLIENICDNWLSIKGPAALVLKLFYLFNF